VQADGHLALDALDLRIIEAGFHEPSDVYLLVRQDGAAGATGGFFFRDGDTVVDLCFLEFPLNFQALPTSPVPRGASHAADPGITVPFRFTPAAYGLEGSQPRIWWSIFGAGLLAALVSLWVGFFPTHP
jgi:hypothetical protein